MNKFILANKKVSSAKLYNILSQANPEFPEKYLAFLAPARIEQLNTIFHQDNVKEKLKCLKTLRGLWRNVLIDAIYFLRINDTREKAFFDINDSKNKTTMKSEGVAELAEQNVYGINDLYKYFEQFSEFESTLYGADKYYRDHLVHPILVWIIGLNVLKEYGKNFNIRVCSNAKIIASDCALPEWFTSDEEIDLELKISTAELSAMWTIIALTHDLGYPLEKVEKINDQLEKMLSQFGKIGFSRSRFNFETQHDHLVRFLLDFISSVAKPIVKTFGGTYNPKDKGSEDSEDKYRWITHKRTKYFTKFSKSWEMFDHGIVSSLILLKSLTFFIESDHSSDFYEKLKKEDARQFSIRSEILHSIAAHTTSKIYHLATNNLPFLLILCDDLQEWARPTLGDMRDGIKGSAKKVRPVQVELSRQLKIKFFFLEPFVVFFISF
jgi:hypothetical protein